MTVAITDDMACHAVPAGPGTGSLSARLCSSVQIFKFGGPWQWGHPLQKGAGRLFVQDIPQDGTTVTDRSAVRSV